VDAERLGDSREHQRRITERSQVNKPHSVLEGVNELHTKFLCQARLAGSPRPGQRDQPFVPTHQVRTHGLQLALAAQERRWRYG
jgi:hypothetical protein